MDFLADCSKLKPCDTLIVIGTKKSVDANLSWVCDSVLTHLIELSTATDNNNNDEPATKKQKVKGSGNDDYATTIKLIADTVKPSSDGGASAEYWIPNSTSADKLMRIVIGVLPESVSRHNSPGQPHNIITLLKKHVKNTESTVFVPLLESQNYMLSVASAAGRVAGIAYSRKESKKSETKDNNNVGSNKQGPLFQVLFQNKDSTNNDELLSSFENFKHMVNNIEFARRLVDTPCNELHTDAFVQEALDAVKDLPNVTTRVIKGKDLDEKGFGGLYGVGKAAAHPPAMVILMFNPPGKENEPSICMVGKGIVYDTGGLSIKSKTSMPGMKTDMGGAAGILGAFCTIVSTGACKRPLHAILCLAENAVSKEATRPDDIHIMYSGKSVEINNTDAEGRLVLADGVSSCVKHMNPEIIIDMATLTGAQGVATGKYFGAIYCNNQELEQQCVVVGRHSGDLVHAMPYAPEFFRPEFKSSVADMKNSVADRSNAQVSCAGQFIGNHLGEFEKTGKWLHIDMAYPSCDKRDDRATGFGVALLYSLVKTIEE